jgi:hypothetical protein
MMVPVEEDEEEEESTTKGVIYLCVGGVMIFLFSNPFIQSVVVTASALQVRVPATARRARAPRLLFPPSHT